MRVCGNCGVAGHNVRTCKVSSNRETKSAETKQDGSRRCGSCGESGHNSRTCSAVSQSKQYARHKEKIGRACGSCRETGHNARTCPNKEKDRGVAKKAEQQNRPDCIAEPASATGGNVRAEAVIPWMVNEGSHYWSAFGDLRWSAVRILDKGRSRAGAERLDPRNGDVIHRKARVRLDELVKRDPSLHGADKPSVTPAELFSEIRKSRLASNVNQEEDVDDKSVLTEGLYETMEPAEYEKLLERLWVKAMVNTGDTEEQALADWNRDWGW